MSSEAKELVTYLNIPYEDREEAKRIAGKLPSGENVLGYDKEQKLWYAKKGADISKLSKWIPDPYKGVSNDSSTDPTIEFSTVLKSAGFVLDDLPIMDGRKHRVRTIEDKIGQKSGIYVGYLDQAKPAGWYQDYRNNEDAITWVSTGKQVDKEVQANQMAILAQRKLERDIIQEKLYAHTSKRVTQLYNLLPNATLDHPYLQRKQITSLEALKGIKIDKKNRLVIPFRNVDGQIMSIQRIDAEGNKRIKKNSQKFGNFFVVGGNLPEPLNGEQIIYAEGFSTAASISQSLGKPVIMTVDAGNMPTVVKNLATTYSKDLHLIFSDDDIRRKGNKGQVKANEAVDYINNNNFGLAINVKPIFTEEELDQKNTDFNDLYVLKGSTAIQEQYDKTLLEILPKALDTAIDKIKKEHPIISNNFDNLVGSVLDSSLKQSIQDDPFIATVEQSIQDDPFMATAEQSIQDDPFMATAEQSIQDDPFMATAEQSIQDDPFMATAEQSIQDENTIEETIPEKNLTNDEKENETTIDTKVNQEQSAIPPETKKEEIDIAEALPYRVSKYYTAIDNKYYFNKDPDTMAFRDDGKALKTKLENKYVVAAMVDLAESKGWTKLTIKGSPEFRREAWLYATAKGLNVKGYTPKETDLVRLKQVAEKLKENVIDGGITTGSSTTNNEAVTVVNKLQGKVIEHGEAPYQNNPENKDSYFVTLQNKDGNMHTTWGIDLQRVFKEEDIQVGDIVELKNMGKQPVTVTIDIKDKNGNVIGKEKKSHYRNEWAVLAEKFADKETDPIALAKENPEITNHVAAYKLAEKYSTEKIPNQEDRAKVLLSLKEKLAQHIAQGAAVKDIIITEETQIKGKEIGEKHEVREVMEL